MATAAKTTVDKPGGTHLHSWTLTTANDVGEAVEMPGEPDKCFQVTGSSFGSGTVKFQGSMDGGTTWFDLHDPTYVAIALTEAGGGAILENPLQIRPTITGSTAATVPVYLFSR